MAFADVTEAELGNGIVDGWFAVYTYQSSIPQNWLWSPKTKHTSLFQHFSSALFLYLFL
jgi:hypothetical protein